jgi:plastocyanin
VFVVPALWGLALIGAEGYSQGFIGQGPEAAVTDDSRPADQSNPPKKDAIQVVIDNFTFRPVELTVKAGTKVTWVNHDDVPHTATSSVKPRAFDSGTLDTDDKFTHTFTTPGTYDYFCALHPKMTGRVVVK